MNTFCSVHPSRQPSLSLEGNGYAMEIAVAYVDQQLDLDGCGMIMNETETLINGMFPLEPFDVGAANAAPSRSDSMASLTGVL